MIVAIYNPHSSYPLNLNIDNLVDFRMETILKGTGERTNKFIFTPIGGEPRKEILPSFPAVEHLDYVIRLGINLGMKVLIVDESFNETYLDLLEKAEETVNA